MIISCDHFFLLMGDGLKSSFVLMLSQRSWHRKPFMPIFELPCLSSQPRPDWWHHAVRFHPIPSGATQRFGIVFPPCVLRLLKKLWCLKSTPLQLLTLPGDNSFEWTMVSFGPLGDHWGRKSIKPESQSASKKRSKVSSQNEGFWFPH